MKSINLRRLLVGIGAGILSLTLVAEHKIPAPGLDRAAEIGQGYDIFAERFVGKCIKTEGRLHYSGAPAASITMKRIESTEKLEQSLGFSVNSKARFGLVTAKLAAEFLSEQGSTSYSDAVTFENAIGLKQVQLVIQDDAKMFLTPAALERLKKGKLIKRSTLPNLTLGFEESCGDEYIQAVTRGAKLFISVKIEFASAYDKQRFGAQVNVSGSFNELSANLNKASSLVKTSASISVSAFQLGGDPNQLGQIISPDVDSNYQDDSVHAFLKCSLANVSACTEFLNGVILYATSNRPGAFRTQLPSEYDPTKSVNGAADLEYLTSPWSDVHLVANNNIVKDDLRVKRRELGQIFERHLVINKRLLELLSGKFTLSQERKSNLLEAQRTLNDIMREIVATSLICYSEKNSHNQELVEACASGMNDLRAFLEKEVIDESLLSLSGDPTECGPSCTLCVEKKCLRCVRAVNDWNLGSYTPGISKTGPTISCPNMPVGEVVAYSATGLAGADGFKPEPGYDYWMDLFLQPSNGATAYSRNHPCTSAWINIAMYTSGIVPDSGLVESLVAPVIVQRWPVVQASAVYHPDFVLQIEARELIKRYGY